MNRRRESLDERLFRILMRSSGRTVAAIALAFYPGVGLIAPIALNVGTGWFILANVFGVTWAAIATLGWLLGQVQAGYRRRLVEWTTNLRLLDAREFEWLVGELFRREGWRVTERGGHGAPDGAIDLELTARDRGRALAQCKRWTSMLVGVDEIRSFAGALLREGLTGRAGIFVTLSGYTDAAKAEGASLGLELVDGPDLYARVERIRRVEPCPVCGAPMVLSRSSRGWWLRCVATGCTGKRDLSPDAGRAAELLIAG